MISLPDVIVRDVVEIPVCPVCGNPIPKKRLRNKRTKYCNNKCRAAVALKHSRMGRNPLLSNISTGSVGAVAELQVCADLLSRGYEAFRAVSPSASCDLIILYGSEMYRIEVRMGSVYYRTGAITYSTQNVRADILAVVNIKDVIYRPDLPMEQVGKK
jgi:hypothetical protein